jgi:5-carboxymethyl-2-hydroxymuconate isomerase
MPHLTLEYTDNLDFDIQQLLERMHTELVATGAINLKGLKSRAIRHTEYRIADGNPDYAFVHVNLQDTARCVAACPGSVEGDVW